MCLLILLSLHKKKLNVKCLKDPYQDLFCSYHTLSYLSNGSSILQCHVYVNETSILYKDSDLNSLVNIVNQEMQQITEWFASNKLNVNVNKSTAMLFHHRQKIINTDNNMIKINNTTVNFSISTKSLGKYIDKIITFNVHTKHINKKYKTFFFQPQK